jgi:glyoxylase-like metal-dependent hydrolase (beta-lactamase superfamily II)
MMSRLALFLVMSIVVVAQGAPGQPPTLKLYVFDCGRLTFDDVASFGLTNDETPVRELFVPCYLIRHARGTLFWDAGLPLDAVGKGTVELEAGVRMSYQRSILDQLRSLGVEPGTIDYVAFSHMHFDHTGAANAFKASKLLIQRTEHVAAFEHGADNPVFQPALYRDLGASATTLLNGDYDVFGDGSVMILSAPGHTPGHQVLFLDLHDTGPLVLSGDLYHFRASRTLRRTPVFNTDAAQTLASMDRIEGLLTERQATLWIEHDKALADGLRLAPAFYE